MQTLISIPAKAPPYAELAHLRVSPRPVGRSGERLRATAAWWLWPHLLSLDAPLVALVWQGCWMRAAHVRVPAYESGVLFLGVWLIYLADRLVDAARARPDDTVAARHAFHDRRRRGLTCLAGAVAVALVLVTPCVLSSREFAAGLLLLGVALLYFWLIHGRQRFSWTARMPKEAVVGGMFALGTVFFPGCQGGMMRLAPLAAATLFGALCFCNCALITAWERHEQDVRDPASMLNAFPRLTARVPTLCIVIAALAVVGGMTTGAAPWLALVVAAGLLAALDRWRSRITPDALRVLADAALLTPLLFAHGRPW